jgi:hypothetical protein
LVGPAECCRDALANWRDYRPCRNPLTVAEFNTLSMRPRTRFAVWGFERQIGSKAFHHQRRIDRGNREIAQTG